MLSCVFTCLPVYHHFPRWNPGIPPCPVHLRPAVHEETKFCNVDTPCEAAKDCLYTGWSQWSQCSASCHLDSEGWRDLVFLVVWICLNGWFRYQSVVSLDESVFEGFIYFLWQGCLQKDRTVNPCCLALILGFHQCIGCDMGSDSDANRYCKVYVLWSSTVYFGKQRIWTTVESY